MFKRNFFYITALITGAAVMIIEILGAKLLAPYVGTSHFVWTSQIAVTLIALTCGYYIGGKLVDRTPNPKVLYQALAVAGLYLIADVIICERVAYYCLQFKLAIGSILASSILFFIPLVCLAMTGPFLTRLLTLSVTEIGTAVGRLTAIGTLGSFLGTMLIGYIVIPLVPNTTTLLCTAGTLLCCSLLFFITRLRNVLGFTVVMSVAIVTAWNVRQSNPNCNYVHNSPFGLMEVVTSKDGNRYYLNDNLIQNVYDPIRKQSAAAFSYILESLAYSYNHKLTNALCIGLGIGSIPMEMAHKGILVDVVEINPDVIPLAMKYFDFNTNACNLTIGDGRYYIRQQTKQYDTIILDAFLGDSMPSHLMTKEAFIEMAKRMQPAGTLVINAFVDPTQPEDCFGTSLYLTLKSVFPEVQMHSNGDGATFFVASFQVIDRIQNVDLTSMHPNVIPSVKLALHRRIPYPIGQGIILTDNFNPIEFLDASKRETRRQNLLWFRKIITKPS